MNFFKKLFSSSTEPKKCCGGHCHEPKNEVPASDNYIKRLNQLEEQVNAAPDNATVGGGAYIRRDGKRKYVTFKTKAQVLTLIAEARLGDIEILLG